MIEKANTEEVAETFVAWPLRIIGVLTSMPLSLKLGLLVLITLLPRVLAFLQPQIITIDGTLYYSGHKESNNLHRDIVILRVLRGVELTSQSASERNIQPAWQSLKLLTGRYLNSCQGNI